MICGAKHSLTPLALQSNIGLPDQTEVECDREKGHEGPHTGPLTGKWHWVDPVGSFPYATGGNS